MDPETNKWNNGTMQLLEELCRKYVAGMMSKMQYNKQ